MVLWLAFILMFMHFSKAAKLLIAVSGSTVTLLGGAIPLKGFAIALAQTPIMEDPMLEFIRLLEEGEMDRVTFSQWMAQGSSDADRHINLGRVLEEAQRLEEAEAAYREALRLEPNHLRAHYGLGSFLQRQGQVDEAIALYKKAIFLASDDTYTYGNIGQLLYELEQYELAETAYSGAIELDSESHNYYSPFGDALNAQGKFQAAEAAYQESIRLFSLNSGFPAYVGFYTHTQLGNALASQHKFAEAAESYQTAIRLALEKESAEAAGVSIESLLSERTAADNRLVLAQVLIAQDPREKSPYPYYLLGTALYRQGEISQAETAYREAIRRYPEEAVAFYALGNLLVEQDKADEAIAFYKEAVRLNDKSDLIYQGLSQALTDQGRSESAERFYQETILPLIVDR
jgi:tetratricopeptide (TPR) repeat protein